MKPCSPVDLREDFALMLEVDIAYIEWLARCGAAESIPLSIYELDRNTTSIPTDAENTQRSEAPIFCPQIQIF